VITLAIDTSAGTSVAVLRDEQVLHEVNFEDTRSHAESIGVAIKQALNEAQVAFNDVQQVAVGIGPAPFTGLRVGIAAAKLFAIGLNSGARPAQVYGVVSLDAIALSAIDAGEVASAENPMLITADARRGEVYWALYSGVDESGIPVRSEGPGVEKLVELEADLVSRGLSVNHVVARVSAGELGRVLAAQQSVGTASTDLTPLYLREADAVMPVSNRLAGKKVSG
jgi:tRNA threonylcarbamoyl adenosine modification protein YeaZ